MTEFLLILSFYAIFWLWANTHRIPWNSLEGVVLGLGILVGTACVFGLMVATQ